MLIFTKMKKEIFQKIDIPAGVEAKIEENVFIVKGPKGENEKKFNTDKLVFEKKDNQIIIGSKKATKKEKKMINTINAHITNMIKGVQKKFEYELKICSSHFPISVKIENKEAKIKNFLGEKIDRKMKIQDDVEIKVDKDKIIVISVDKELAGQTAADFEKLTKIRMRDRRVFQDGIYITNKSGREI